MLNHYELLYLVPSNFTEDELVPIKNKVLDIVKKYGGQISFEDNFGKKRLAYPVSKNHQGYYLICEFDLEGENLKALDKELGLTNEVLRHMLVKKKLKASGVMQKPTLNLDSEPRPIEKAPHAHAKPEMPKVAINQEEEKDKLKLEDLDEKLDEILEGDIM